MKYKNSSERVLEFRAFDLKGKKRRFALKPGQEFESDRKCWLQGLEEVMKRKSNKTTEGE